MKSDEAFAAEQSLEAKLESVGADQVRRFGPDTTAPVEEPPAVETETEAEAQPRDDAGRFTTPDDPEVAPPEEEVPALGQVEGDPAVSAFLQKYGGDVNKAIAGAVHLQRKAGEQSNELGELRRMVDELSQLRETIQGGQQQQQTQPVLDQATVDWFDQQAVENPHGAAEYARQQGNDILLQRALATWKDMDPYGASVYTNGLQNAQFQQQIEERLAQAQQLPMDTSVHMALTNARSRHPEFSNYDDAIAETMQRYPAAAEAVQAAAATGESAKLEAAIETLYALAQGDTLRDLALSGPAPETATTTADVAAPTVSEPHEAAPEPSSLDRFKTEFQEEATRLRRGVFVAE